MPIPPESNLDAIRSWLLAREKWPANKLDTDQLRQFLLFEDAKVRARSSSELVAEAEAEAMHDAERSKRLLSWTWRHECIRLCEFGPWRSVGDALPFEACRRSAVEAATFLRQNPDALPGSADRNLQARYQLHASRIRVLAELSDVLREFTFLSVLVAAAKHRGREGCEALPYSSEDGSHRAIAMALAGHDTILAWVGSPG